MSIIKKQKKNFTQISNKLLNDNNLSFKAKGLFAFMDSKPDKWNFTIKSIASQTKEGIESISSAMKELKNNGYMTYKKYKDGHGEYELFDEPYTENQYQGIPNKVKHDRISNTDLSSNTDLRGVPTQEQVLEVGRKLGYDMESCTKFYNYYSSMDWKRGRSPIKDFIPLLRNWNMNEKPKPAKKKFTDASTLELI